jgi:hypothetical protein
MRITRNSPACFDFLPTELRARTCEYSRSVGLATLHPQRHHRLQFPGSGTGLVSIALRQTLQRMDPQRGDVEITATDLGESFPELGGKNLTFRLRYGVDEREYSSERHRFSPYLGRLDRCARISSWDRISVCEDLGLGRRPASMGDLQSPRYHRVRSRDTSVYIIGTADRAEQQMSPTTPPPFLAWSRPLLVCCSLMAGRDHHYF